MALTVAVKVTVCPTADGLADDVSAVAVAPCVTDCATAGDVLPAKLPFAEYVAVIVCTPGVRSAVGNVVCPAERVPVPMAVAPSKNVTVPAGVPEPLVTVAVNVMLVPKEDGFRDEASVVLVAMPFTVCDSAAEVLGSKVASP